MKSTTKLTGFDVWKFDPFTPTEVGGNADQIFLDNDDWVESITNPMNEYFEYVKRGLVYHFKQQPQHRFIRKLYMSAGTDAHGDFNYLQSSHALVLHEATEIVNSLKIGFPVVTADNNAFARARTYTLTCERRRVAGQARGKIPADRDDMCLDPVGPLEHHDRPPVGPNAGNHGHMPAGPNLGNHGRPPVGPNVGNHGHTPTGPNLGNHDRPPVGPNVGNHGHHPTGNQPGNSTSTSLSESVMAYREGNTVLTDGPIGTMSMDANCRFNSDPDILAWHDNVCGYDNVDGSIGGKGVFDGGGTMLQPLALSSNAAWIKIQWKGGNDYYPEDEGQTASMKMSLTHLKMNSSENPITTKWRGVREFSQSAFQTSKTGWMPSAFVLQGILDNSAYPERQSMFLTNPIWTAPYQIEIEKPAACPIQPKKLKVLIKFGISMDPTIKKGCSGPWCVESNNPYPGTLILVKPLDESGQTGNTAFRLMGERNWSTHDLTSQGKVANAVYSATNLGEIPCGANWNSATHKAGTGKASYAVVVTDLRDMHGNPLNAVADTFTTQGTVGPAEQ